MKIKTKLRFGFGFLFIMVLAFGALSGFYLNKIARDSKVILKNNYESIGFSREMRKVLDNNSLPLPSEAVLHFEQQLKKQEGNLTESGEKEVTQNIRKNFGVLQSHSELLAERSLRHDLTRVEELNMKAIVRKNDQAQASVSKATLYLQFIGGLILLILFSFSVNFPSFIANPLLQLKEGIQEISRKNYKTRLNFPESDEFSPLAEAFNQMTSRLNEWENSNIATILSEKSRIETIIEQMQDGIIGLNEKGEIIFINRVAETLLNVDEAKVIGINASEVAGKNDLLKTLLENKQSEKPVKIYSNDKESYFQIESREITVPDYDQNRGKAVITTGKSAGEVYILRNITRFRELDEAKTNFIATISHELKTPISSIKMSLQLLTDRRVGNLNKEQTDLVDLITDDTQRLLKITSELLDLAQVETGNIQLSFLPTDPDEIVNYAINSIKFQADQKNIQLEYHRMTDSSKVQVDVEKTTWVMINFLSNALRYSPDKSKIVITIKPEKKMIEFSVKDFGKGIEEQYQKRLFERYFQVPTDGKNKSGTGLGLAISKDFIEAQQGEIFVESELGAGSRFGFRLPVYKG